MTVQHDAAGTRFFVTLPDGEAELRYASFGADLLDIRHTAVPRSARGQGVADALVRAALEYARDHRLQVVVTCGYTRQWLKKHPQERPPGTIERPA